MTGYDDEEIVAPSATASLSLRERELRDNFVREYLTDYDPVAAAGRIGYSHAFAKEYGVKLMNDPYVLQRIKQFEGDPEDESPETARRQVIAGLKREANFRGAGSSQAARVAALSKLATIYGLDKVAPTDPNDNEMEGTFVVPGMMTTEEWEKKAAAQQAALTAPEPAPVTTQAAPTVH